MENLISLEGKTILVSGASSGIGRQCAIEASKVGANVVALGRDRDRLNETLSALAQGNHFVMAQDITKFQLLEEVVSTAVTTCGLISGFVHSAGIEITLPLQSMSFEKYNKLFSLNVFSGFEIARIIAKKKYCNPNNVSFLFIASIMGLVGNKALTGYSATKGALISGAKSMAVELAKKKIRVNCISPGFIETEMMDIVSKKLSNEQMDNLKSSYLLGFGTPKDVANACLFLLSDASRWITGINLLVDGGYTCK